MYILTNQSDVVVYSAPEIILYADRVELRKKMNSYRKIIDRQYSSQNATSYRVDSLPTNFQPFFYTYTTANGFALTPGGEAYEAEQEVVNRREKAAQVKTELESLLESNDSDVYIDNCTSEQQKNILKILVNKMKETANAKR